jgi:hypothetical protein
MSTLFGNANDPSGTHRKNAGIEPSRQTAPLLFGKSILLNRLNVRDYLTNNTNNILNDLILFVIKFF